MYFSRMCTARFSARLGAETDICPWGCLPREGICPGGVSFRGMSAWGCLPRGCLPRGRGRHPPVRRVRLIPSNILNEMFQSLIDLVVSIILLTSTFTVRDTHTLYNDGILGEIECRLWNTQMFLWGFLTSSTWNMVSLTFER